jgi:hypothetical protein
LDWWLTNHCRFFENSLENRIGSCKEIW